MPEIDTELFQQVALGLLVLLLLVGLLILSALGKIRKAIERAGSGAPARTGQPEPEPEAQPQAAAEPTPTDSYSQPWGEASTQPQPAVAASPAAAAEPVATSTEAMPEEQPFERDGRWWFKRGDELLVYDEQTGQWAPAPSGTQAATPAPGTATTEFGEVAAGEGGFWKCPSCGAVNGSTSATCRMCFSPRPA